MVLPHRCVDLKLAGTTFWGHKEWETEINVLGVVKHPNLVKLVGYCTALSGTQLLLVYEYMPNKSVRDHLSAKSETPLSWTMRLKVAQDAARGLAYLHEEMHFQIIFRDFKSSNILLDDQWNAKLSDFGVARIVGAHEGLTHISTAFVGTLGYAAPEYLTEGHLTSKSDVWSYGVFLYELITGRRPLDRKKQRLIEWVNSKEFISIIDSKLEDDYSLNSAEKLANIANCCLIRDPKSRPKMSEVLEMVNQLIEVTSQTTNPPKPPTKGPVLEESITPEKKIEVKFYFLVQKVNVINYKPEGSGIFSLLTTVPAKKTLRGHSLAIFQLPLNVLFAGTVVSKEDNHG
ncbi:probable serine/threonine-protein kinase PBL19 [Tanacetum coccineum]